MTEVNVGQPLGLPESANYNKRNNLEKGSYHKSSNYLR